MVLNERHSAYFLSTFADTLVPLAFATATRWDLDGDSCTGVLFERRRSGKRAAESIAKLAAPYPTARAAALSKVAAILATKAARQLLQEAAECPSIGQCALLGASPLHIVTGDFD